MHIRDFQPTDLPALIDLTIEAFRPLFEVDLPALLDPAVFAHDHGSWADDYRREVPTFHDPEADRFIVLAEETAGDGSPLGYVAWQVNADGSGRLQMVAVHPDARRRGVGKATCRGGAGTAAGTGCHRGPRRYRW